MRITGSVSIVIPMYNEAGRLATTLEQLEIFISAYPQVSQVVMVDDGSTDETPTILRHRTRDLPVTIVSYSANAGKGHAIRRGVIEATGEILLISDADLSTPLSEIGSLAPHLESFDVVIGSRALDPSSVRTHQPWYRQAMGKTFNRITRLLTGLPFRDTQCGFKLFRAEAAHTIFRQAVVDRFAFDVEALLIALHNGYSVVEVPVIWHDVEGSRVSIGRDSARMLIDTLRTTKRLGRPPIARTALIGTPPR